MFLNDLDSDLFQRMGILAAFDSWERAKRLISFTQLFKKIVDRFLVHSMNYSHHFLHSLLMHVHRIPVINVVVHMVDNPHLTIQQIVHFLLE
jgi:hypothetical protein